MHWPTYWGRNNIAGYVIHLCAVSLIYSLLLFLQCHMVPLLQVTRAVTVITNSAKFPYGPAHITHTVVDVGQRHSLVAWGGRWCSLVRQTWCSPHHELEQQSHSLVASGASLARLSPMPCIPLLQGPWWWILTCVSLHITSSLYHCKWLHHPPHDFDKLASIWGQGSGSQCPGLCIMSVPPGKR